MIIDFHTHMFPDKIAQATLSSLSEISHIKPYTDGTYEGLKASTNRAGIDLSVVLPVATSPKQFDSVNRFALEHSKDEILSFGCIHPDNSDYKEKLNWLKEQGFKGIKLHPDYQEAFFNDIRYKRIVSYATELGLIICVHAGRDPKSPDLIHCTPQMALEVIEEVQPEKLVLAHMGGNDQWEEVEELLVGRNVYFDTGVVLNRMPQEQFLRIVRNHGSNRILFGTDSPWADQKEFVELLDQMPLDDKEKEDIYSGTARSLLGTENPA